MWYVLVAVICFIAGFITACLLAANRRVEIANEAYEAGFAHGCEVGAKEHIRTTK